MIHIIEFYMIIYIAGTEKKNNITFCFSDLNIWEKKKRFISQMSVLNRIRKYFENRTKSSEGERERER